MRCGSRVPRYIVLVTMLVLSVLGGPAAAAPIIDFMSGAGGGTISYGGACPATALCGTNIVIEKVGGIGTPEHSGTVLNVTQGLLSFTTGSLVSYSNGVYTYAPGETNSFTITGAVPGASIANTILLTGQLSSVTVDTTGGSGAYLTIINGSSDTSAALAAYFGLTGTDFDVIHGTLHIQPTTNCKPSCSASTPFAGTAFSIFIPEFQALAAAPEPATLFLLGTGLLGAAAGHRRLRRSREAARG